METPTQEEILATVKPGAVPQPPPEDVLDETEVEEEVNESEDTGEEVIDTEPETEPDSDDEPEDDGTDEDDDEVYLEYTLNGEQHKVNLADPTDLDRVKKALELTGLEVKTQHAVEGRREAERRAEAAEVKLREIEALREAEKPLEPWRKAIENPQFRAQVARQNPNARLPQVDFNPEVARANVENQQLRAKQLQADNQQELTSITAHVKSEFGLDDNQVSECVGYLASHSLGFDQNKPVKEQREQIIQLVSMARQALIGEGRLPNPEVIKAQAETEKVTKKFKAAKKRKAARNPSPGTGTSAAKAGSGGADLAGASIDAVMAEYKRRSGK